MSAGHAAQEEESAASSDEVAAAEAEVADLRTRLRAAKRAIAELRARLESVEAGSDADTAIREQVRGRRHEVRRLYGERRAARERLRAAKRHAAAARKEKHAARHRRVAAAAAAIGVEAYFPDPDDADDTTWLPGYARKPQFLNSRRAFVRTCRQLGGLRAGDRVLDVGCGIGGVAVFLIDVVGAEGSYVGLDVEQRSIDACRRNIGSSHPNFSFDVMDVFSSKYNAGGRYQPGEYRFPYDDGEFDFAIMRSLFTHMVPDDIDHYLSELGRLLKPGGRTAITFFLIDEAAERAWEVGTAHRSYPHRFDVYRLDNADVAEAAVAVDEAWVRDAYARNGFDISSIEYGGWREMSPGPKQDTVFATRR